MSNVSVVRPSGIGAAQTLSAWAQDTIKDIAATKKHKLHADLQGSAAATRLNVEFEMLSCRALFFFGHGVRAELLNGNTPIVDVHNVGRASGNLLVAIACKSAHTLGNAAIRTGVEAYLGFDEDLGWTTGTSLQLWGNALVIGLSQMLLHQATVDDAATKMRGKFDSIVQHFKYGLGKNDANAQLAYLWATWDKAHICVKGNGAALL